MSTLQSLLLCAGVSRGRGAGRRGGGQAGGRGRGVVLDEPLVLPDMSDPQIPAFEGQPGLKLAVAGDRPLDYYRLFLTDKLIDHFITETNLYADQIIAVSRPQKQFGRLKDWKKVDQTESQIFGPDAADRHCEQTIYRIFLVNDAPFVHTIVFTNHVSKPVPSLAPFLALQWQQQGTTAHFSG